MELVIGTKTWSSWSLRPWLALKHAGIAFDERVIQLRQPNAAAEITLAGSPNERVPILKDGSLTVWDSLAICEYVADLAPQANLWPADREARALARSATAEMHAGFPSLRGECPMDIGLRCNAELTEITRADVRRVIQLWGDLRERFASQGDFLCGTWSIADAFFTPVATRFRSYGVRLSDYGDRGPAGVYGEVLLATDAFRQWEAEALAEGVTEGAH